MESYSVDINIFYQHFKLIYSAEIADLSQRPNNKTRPKRNLESHIA